MICPQLFLSTGPAAQTAQKQKSLTNKSPLMQDWIFRQGLYLKNKLFENFTQILIDF